MDLNTLLARLPAPYALGLRLRAADVDDVGIAVRLGIEPAAVEPLLILAAAKLDAARLAMSSDATPAEPRG